MYRTFEQKIFVLVFFLILFSGCRGGNGRISPESENGERNVRENGNGATEKTDGLRRNTDVTPWEILKKMAATYRSANSYSDHGLVRIVGQTTDPRAEPILWPCTVAFQRPNRLRLELNDGVFVSDGEDCFAQIRSAPEQVLKFPSPNRWTLENLFRDVFMDRSMDIGLPGEMIRFAPQLILLFAEDPLKTILPEQAVAEFLEPQWLNESPCDLIQIDHVSGNRILWIDRESGALLRFDYLVEGLPVPEGFESIRLIRIDMTDARFDKEIAPEAFQMMQPDGARLVDDFLPDEAMLLGKTPDDVDSLVLKPVIPSDADAISFSDLAEQTVVLCFWTTWSEPSRTGLDEWSRVRDMLGEDKRVRFIAVNMDDVYPDPRGNTPTPEKPNPAAAEIQQTLSRWNLSTEVFGDAEFRWTESLRIDSFPTIVVLAPKGRVEFYRRGIVSAAILGNVVRDLLSGKSPHEKERDEIQRLRKEHRDRLKRMQENGAWMSSFNGPEVSVRQHLALPQTPSGFSLEERWTIGNLTSPGNITALSGNARSDGTTSSPLLLIPCDGNLLARIDPRGILLDKTKPTGLRDDELLTTIRTGIDALGKRYIGISSVSGRTVHVYDEDLIPVLSYTPHQSGTSASNRIVSDFRFMDVHGNGTLSLLVATIGLDGAGDSLIAVDLHGEVLWQDDSVPSPILVDSYLMDGKREISCLSIENRRGTLLRFGGWGKRLEPFDVGENRQVVWFGVEESIGEFRTNLCAILAGPGESEYHLAALDAKNGILWQQPLPLGEFQKPIDQIVAVDLIGDEPTEWLVPTPDGTVNVFDGEGRHLDSFGFGEFLTGLAVIFVDGKRLLIVADERSVTAWDVVVGSD